MSLTPAAQNGLTLWFTGMPCAGKSTLANYVGEELIRRGRRVEILDADQVRKTICKGLGFSKSDRNENVMRIGWLCRVLNKHGVIAIGAVISPYRMAREQLRGGIPNFVEIYVKTSLSVCMKRDVKGMYAKAIRGEILHFTGVDDPYEEPVKPELIVETDTRTILDCSQSVVSWLEQNSLVNLGPPRAAGNALGPVQTQTLRFG